MPKRYGLEISVKLPQVFYLEVDDNDAGVVDSWQLVCYDGKYPSRHFQWDSRKILKNFLLRLILTRLSISLRICFSMLFRKEWELYT